MDDILSGPPSFPEEFTLHQLPFFPESTLSQLSFFPEETTLSQLPFFPRDDGVEDSCLPPRPPSVCQDCWEGPFSRHFGLHLVSSQSGEWDHIRPDISYSTSRTKLESRAAAGCVWCRLILKLCGHSKVETYAVTVREMQDGYESDPGRALEQFEVQINDDFTLKQTFSVYTNRGDPAASHIRTRGPILDVGSARTMALARQRINECVRTHERCKISVYPSPRLPTRLVDCTDHTRPRLVSTTEEHGEYLALSYVWGKDQIHKTTSANKSTYEQGIALGDLPLTIRDAIYVTHMLRFRWLWVDSLCIVQDSDEDKRHEIGHMHNIYRFAHLTIMAGSAKDASEGFLQERPPLKLNQPLDSSFFYPYKWAPVSLPFICPPRTTTSTEGLGDCLAPQSRVGTVSIVQIYSGGYDTSLGCMATRAWCMQEYLMSPRALIFTPETLAFRCLRTLTGLGDSLCPSMFDEPGKPAFIATILKPIAEPPHSPMWLVAHQCWMALVEKYTNLTASDESDKLLACAAIAKQVFGILDSEYLAGLCRSDALPISLLWRAHGKKLPPGYRHMHTRPQVYRAPSWSWAAIEGPIDYSVSMWELSTDSENVQALVKVDECWVTLEDPAAPFGRVTDGALVLRGTLIPCHDPGPSGTRGRCWNKVPLPSFEQVRHRWQCGLQGLISDEEDNVYSMGPVGCASQDMYFDIDDELPGRMWLVPLVSPNSAHCCIVHGIVLDLAPSSNSSGSRAKETRFRRIGCFRSKFSFDEEHSLWRSLVRAVKDGEPPWTDIVIV